MPETTVTVDFIGEDDVTPALNKIKGTIDGLTKAVEIPIKVGTTSAMADLNALKEKQDEFWAAERIRKGTTYIRVKPMDIGGGPPPGGLGGPGGGPPAVINETKESMGGMFSEMGKMAEQFVKWGLIWKVFERGVKGVGEAMKQLAEETDIARQAQNSFGFSMQQGEAYLKEYREAAHEIGSTWGDWQKFAPPAIHSLEDVGLSAEDALSETKHLGEILGGTGVDLRKLAPAVELGTANFQQLAEAGRLMGPAWAQGVAAFEKMEATEKQYNQELAHTHTLEQQAVQDSERLANAREGFAQQTGIAASAYQAFAVKGQVSPFAQVPEALAKLTPYSRFDFKKILGDMQKDFADGAQQMSKELDIPLSHVQKYIQLGAPGFDEKSLMAAHQRGVHEKDTSKEREFQEQNYQRQSTIEKDRLTLNEQVATSLKGQNDFLREQPGLIKATELAWEGAVSAYGDFIKNVAKPAAAGLETVVGKGQALPLMQALPTLLGLPAQIAAPIVGPQQAPSPSGGEAPASEGTLQKIQEFLSQILTGS